MGRVLLCWFRHFAGVRAEQHFGSRLVEYERNMAERTWLEVGANRAEVTSALEAVAANNAQLVAQENIAFEQRDRALRQTVREEFDGYRAHLALERQEDIPAHVKARIADVCDFFRVQFNEGARRVEQHAREHCEMFAAALDNARAHAENRCERLEEGFFSDPFRESSLVFESSMPAAPEQIHGVCGPETPVADVGVEAARWAIPVPRDVNIADEDSSEESIGEETDRRRAVVKPIDLGRPPTGPGFQRWLAELHVNCCAES